MTSVARWGCVAVGVVAAAFVIYLVAAPEHFHWDFRVYYRAADALRGGGDPYAERYPVEIGFMQGPLPFVYPPVVLALFVPFTWLPEGAAVIGWLALELVALGALIAVWRRFAPVAPTARVALVLLLGFNAAIYTALAAGNVALFEALALYAGFDALLRDKPGRFAALVILAAAIKLTPIVFLPALLVWGGPRRFRVLAIACAAVAALVAVNALGSPDYAREFWTAASGLDERHWTNPTLLAWLRDLGDHAGLAAPELVDGVIACAVLAITGARIAKLRPDARTVVPLLFVVAALVLPRFKSYTYLELLPAALVAMEACKTPGRIALGALLCVVLPWSYLMVAWPSGCRAWESAIHLPRDVWGYTPLVGAIAVWVVYLTRVLPRAQGVASPPPDILAE